MSEEKSPTNKILNRQKLALFTSENASVICKMTRGVEEFYFDTTDLPKHQPEFDEMGEYGWILVEKLGILPAYLHARLRALEEAGLAPTSYLEYPYGWGYQKKK